MHLPLHAPGSLPRLYAGVASVFLLIASGAGGCSTTESAADQPRHVIGRPAPTSEQTDTPESDRFREGALWYRIGLSGAQLEVTVRLLNPSRRSSFFLPTAEKNRAAVARALTIQGASGPDGAVPLDQIPAEQRLDVESAGLDWVELHYSVDLEAYPDDSPRPLPDFASGTVLAYVSSILVVPSKQVVSQIRDIPVEIHAPSGWSLHASWRSGRERRSATKGRDVHGFVAADVRDLRDAFFVAGPEIRSVRDEETELVVALQPDLAGVGRRITPMVARILGNYRERFGATGETLVYVRPARSRAPNGVRGTAKRGGFVVRLPRRRPLRETVHLLVAHEAFHLWNGHRLVPDPETERQTRWFKEGVTHYVAIKTLYAIGHFDLEDVRRELAKSAFFYRRNPASRGGRASRLDMHRLPYDRGVLLALGLDAALARCAPPEKGVGEWIRGLLAGHHGRYDTDSLREGFEELFDEKKCPEGEQIWRRHIDGHEPIVPKDLFERAGLHYLEASTVEETEVLPLRGERATFESLFERADTSPRSGSATNRTPFSVEGRR